jgi:hypothetical protein
MSGTCSGIFVLIPWHPGPALQNIRRKGQEEFE